MDRLKQNPPSSLRVMVDGVWTEVAASFQWSDGRSFVGYWGPGLKFLIPLEKIPLPPS
jgi:hypothetical protein